MKFDIEDFRPYADRHRGRYVKSGPHWPLVLRYPVLFDEVERLREALDFYADEEIYEVGIYDSDLNANEAPLIFDDGGERARNALKGGEG